MERLHFGPDAKYSALEAAIHVARYALAKSVCPGKTVLDVACGEGYGSWLLASWGAASVTGIDISADAVDIARQRFGGENIEFGVADATRIPKVLGEKRFDLIVSIETIEHVRKPEKLLEGIRAVAAPGATIIITCPNDHWYYAESEGNPFHTRKYRFEEFRALTESVLGPATSFRIGSLAAGFGSIPLGADAGAAPDDDQSAMMRVRPIPTGLMVPGEDASKPTPQDCSFFVGIWGREIDEVAMVTFPLSMNASDRSLFGGPRISELNDYIRRLETRRDELEAELATSASPDEHGIAKLGRTLQAAIEGLRAERAEMLAFLRTERNGAVKAQLAERDKDIDDLRAALADNKERSRTLAADLASRTEELAVLQETLRGRESEMSDLQRTLRGTSLRLRGVMAENQVLRERASQLLLQSGATDEARSQVETLDAHIRTLEGRIAEQESRIAERENRIAEQEAALARAGAENAALHEQAHQLATQLEAVPWRVVGVYRKVRPLVPRRLLKLGASAIDSRGRRP
jgi:SAM-dependent methyltransferase/uncharacterized coiled-coil protein SlyX